MRTLTLRNMQQPSYLDTLLYSLVMELGILPPEAYPVRDTEKLPPALKAVVETVTQVGQSWGCWTDDTRHWLFTAKLPVTRGKPIVHLKRHDETGEPRETISWGCDNADQWHRLSVP